jgi:signal transduction histidine kinase
MAILAHELRNPLAALRFGLDLLRERASEPPSPKALEVLDRQTAMLGRLVEDLLDISRIKADKIELRPEPLELASVLDEAISMARPLIEDRGHLLTVDSPTDSVVVMADNLRLGQVIANVINNAARYTPHGGRIDVMVDAVEDFGIVRVRDTGIGIPIEHQHRVFEMFAQERGHSESSSGLGLGLALARRLLELHHGAIAVASEGRDRGSTFEIRVPKLGSPLALAPRKRTRELDPALKHCSVPSRQSILDERVRYVTVPTCMRRDAASESHAVEEIVSAQRSGCASVRLGDTPPIAGTGRH